MSVEIEYLNEANGRLKRHINALEFALKLAEADRDTALAALQAKPVHIELAEYKSRTKRLMAIVAGYVLKYGFLDKDIAAQEPKPLLTNIWCCGGRNDSIYRQI